MNARGQADARKERGERLVTVSAQLVKRGDEETAAWTAGDELDVSS
jgi:hypothetical protein